MTNCSLSQTSQTLLLFLLFLHPSLCLSISFPLHSTHSHLPPHTHLPYVAPLHLFVISLFIVLPILRTLLLCSKAMLHIFMKSLMFLLCRFNTTGHTITTQHIRIPSYIPNSLIATLHTQTTIDCSHKTTHISFYASLYIETEIHFFLCHS